MKDVTNARKVESADATKPVDEVRETSARTIFNSGNSTIVVGFVAQILCAFALHGIVETVWLAVWLLAGMLLCAARLVFVRAAQRASVCSGFLIPYMIPTVLTGCLWGVLSLAWTADMSTAGQLILLVFPVGIAIGAVSSYAPWLPLYYCFSFPAQMPFVFVLLQQSNPMYAKLAAPALLCMVGQVLLARAYSRQIRTTTQLATENMALVEDLSLQNSELKQARDDAGNANRAKNEFLARMSHEIRTPMNGVLGMTELLQGTELSEVQQTNVSTLESSARQLLTLINELLDVSRMEAGQFHLETSATDLPALINARMFAHQALARDKQLALTWSIDGTVPQWVTADGERLSQVINHLLGNALKFTEAGSVIVEASAEEEADGEYCVQIAVTDTGIGIDATRADAIFELFQQADGSVTRKYGGAGLGLSLAQELVKLMGGRISVTSELGEGATFTVQLRLAQAQPVSEHSTQRSDLMTRSVSNSDGYRVLVAEDNPVNQSIIEAMLEGLGCDVVLTDDGQEALDVLEQERDEFDLVFMDCQMPGKDGFTATREARDAGYAIPIIAVTANVLPGDREACIDSGMNDYISKPFNTKALQAALSRWGASSNENDRAVVAA